MLWRGWSGSILRRRHLTRGGSVRALRELRKIAILEATADKPLHEREGTSSSLLASSSSSISPLATGSVLQSLDSAVEAAYDRMNLSKSFQRGAAVSGSSTSHKAASLSHFLTECRRLRLEIGEARDAGGRRRLRDATRVFWAENVDGALACCAMQGRDFGFVAGFGLIDNDLHLCFSSLQLALHCMARDKSTCACTSMVLALHYMARELDHLEKTHAGPAVSHAGWGQQRRKQMKDKTEVKRLEEDGSGAAGVAAAAGSEIATPEELESFRRGIATLGVERLHLFFIERGQSGRVLGSAEDALHALEFLTIVKVDDAGANVRALVEAENPRWCQSCHTYLVLSLFRHVTRKSKDLKLTSVVHAFKLLRIFMPLLSPSAPPPSSSSEDKQQQSSSMQTAAALHFDSHAAHAVADGNAPLPHVSPAYREWQIQRDTVDGVLWGLCAALQRKDARFVNSFHFVQIMTTISRLPPHFLSRPPHPRRRAIQNFGVFATTTSSSTDGEGATPLSRARDEETPQTAEEVWGYLIAKACIFIPGLTSDQRRRVCYGLRLAVQKREGYFHRTTSGGKNRRSNPSPAEALLLPMAHELLQYPKDYEAAMFDHPPAEGRGGY
ncbi:hypothetical protein MOQ_001880 [Trypanosoma cruzi marinkellei]|uniref:Uncharacterized protein n=1 Tax=Trypanosoma cruzi marinkellei TaxID=85056 RepID=K2MRI1_TRYCR|nr:hypothetical protein MOQ_001880 [Trypanosoma cruzi marinkellei]